MICGVYAIRNKINGHEYIGSSGDIKTRWKRHRTMLRGNRHHTVYLQRAWNKYGESAFEFVVLKEVEDLVFWEQKIILERNPTYNGTKVVRGDTAGTLKWTKSEETRRKLSIANRGKERSEETKQILREYAKKQTYWGERPCMKGVKKSEEHKRKIGIANRGNKSRTGYKNSPEATEKVRLALLGRPRPPHVIEAVRNAHIGKKMTPEQIEANRIRNTGAGNAMYGKKKPPEEIQRRLRTFYRKRIVRVLDNFTAKRLGADLTQQYYG